MHIYVKRQDAFRTECPASVADFKLQNVKLQKKRGIQSEKDLSDNFLSFLKSDSQPVGPCLTLRFDYSQN